MSFKEGEIRKDFQARCPYNPNHQMPESRLLFHISKGCKDKEQKAHLFAHCPYNYLHIVRKEDIDQHLKKCKSKPEQSNEWPDQDIQIQETIDRQFGKQQIQQEKEEILKKNETIPGLGQDIVKIKKKRIRNRKLQQVQNQSQDGEDDGPDWDKYVDESQKPENQIKEQQVDDLQFLNETKKISEVINQSQVMSIDNNNDDGFTEVQDFKIKKKQRNYNQNSFDEDGPRQRNQRRNR